MQRRPSASGGHPPGHGVDSILCRVTRVRSRRVSRPHRWPGPVEPTLETLAGLTRAHISRIPFENVDVLLGRGIRIDLDSIARKMVVDGRGGYCFEHGTLFQAALERLGFQLHRARRARRRDRAPPSGSAHAHVPDRGDRWRHASSSIRASAVTAPLVPVPLRDGVEVRDGVDRHRMVRRDGEWVLEAEIDGTMTPLWTSTLEPQLPIDFELANHWVSTSPASVFVNRLMLRALTPGGRTSVMNRDVTVCARRATEKYQLADRRALRALLGEHFGFDLPDVEQLRVPSVPEWS